jgi:small-conductance mechanosensitive channel
MRAADTTIEQYVRRLDRALSGPGRVKADVLAEARDSLIDAAEAYREGGLAHGEAERQAVREFGPVDELAPAYQREMAAGAARRLALRVALAYLVVASGSVLMWWDAPWTGTEPPTDYLRLSAWVDGVGYGGIIAALAAYAWLTHTARRGRPVSASVARAVAVGTAVLLAVTWLGGAVVFVWSVRLWDAALTWPPMLVGAALLALAFGWLGRSAAACLASARAPA